MECRAGPKNTVVCADGADAAAAPWFGALAPAGGAFEVQGASAAALETLGFDGALAAHGCDRARSSCNETQDDCCVSEGRGAARYLVCGGGGGGGSLRRDLDCALDRMPAASGGAGAPQPSAGAPPAPCYALMDGVTLCGPTDAAATLPYLRDASVRPAATPPAGAACFATPAGRGYRYHVCAHEPALAPVAAGYADAL